MREPAHGHVKEHEVSGGTGRSLEALTLIYVGEDYGDR
jgi:hypothetical protein